MGNPRKILPLLMICILLIAALPIEVTAIEGFTDLTIYEGYPQSDTLRNNLLFRDIQGHWARDVIQEIGALSVMRGKNTRQFSPEGTLTHLEALTTLVRAVGLEGEAQQLAENQMPQQVREIVITSVVEDWGRGHLQAAIQNNIITAAEVQEITNLTPEELEALEQQVENRLQPYQDSELTPQEMANLQNQIRNQIEFSRWNQPIERQQVARWIARALELEGVYGENMTQIYGFNDWRQIDTDKIPFVEKLLQEGYMSGISSRAFSPKGNLTRGQMAQLMYNIQGELLEERGITTDIGRILNIETTQGQGGATKIFTVRNQDNSTNHIAVKPTTTDFLVRKQGALELSEILRIGDTIEYYRNQQDQVFYATIEVMEERTVEGFIDFIDPETMQLIVTDFNNNRHTIRAQPKAEVRMNDKQAAFKDLLYGQEVKIFLRGETVTSIDGYLEEDPYRHGYIPPGSRTKVGDTLFIDADTIEIRVGDNREKYRITSSTNILRKNTRANLFEVKEGDRVLLSFDDIYSADIATIQVEDHERHIDSLYRGRIELVNQRSREIILHSVSQYTNGRWTRHPDQKVKLRAENNQLYEGASNIDLGDLGKAINAEVYVAVENSYGVPRVAKLLVKEGSTVVYDNNISSLEFGNSRMVVDNNSFNFHPGTIVVKDNRLVDILNLQEKQSVHVIADLARASRNAALISIEDGGGLLDDRIDSTRLVVYQGSLEDIHDYGVTIGRLAYQLDFLQLENNQWKEVGRRQDFTLTEDSLIYDSELEKEITSSGFMDTRFIDVKDVEDEALRRRIENDFYIGKTAYFLVKETSIGSDIHREVLALNLAPKVILNRGTVNTDHSTIGQVKKVDLEQEQLLLSNVRHWNALSGNWQNTYTEEVLELDKAVITINDRPINNSEFYLIRENAKVYVIKNRTTSQNDEAYVVIVEQ
ncbi:MAG: S-layer homology domain-containing protein [Clostridiaceae bacterium]|nr:S-layer homology domain-containing protein [Clostridiaceae bacterium]